MFPDFTHLSPITYHLSHIRYININEYMLLWYQRLIDTCASQWLIIFKMSYTSNIGCNGAVVHHVVVYASVLGPAVCRDIAM